MSVISTAFANTYERLYKKGDGFEIALREKPLVKMFMKNKKRVLAAPGSTDEAFVVRLNTAMASSVGSTLAAARQNKHLGRVDRFLVTTATRYSVMELTAADLRFNSKSELGALIDNKARAMKGVVESFLDSLEREIAVGSANAHMGQFTKSSNTLTMGTGVNLVGLQIGDHVRAYSDEAGTTSASDITTVTAINRGGGVVEVADASTFSNSDYLFKVGNTSGQIKGIPDYITTSTSPSSLWGLTRTTDVEGLSGFKGSFRGTVSDTLNHLVDTQMAGYVDAYSSKILMHPQDLYTLKNELGSQVWRTDDPDKEFGTRKVYYNSAIGDLEIVTSKYLRQGRGYIIDPSTWAFHHIDDVPHVADEDGNTFLRTSDDTYEWRLRAWMQLVCDTPMRNSTFACT